MATQSLATVLLTAIVVVLPAAYAGNILPDVTTFDAIVHAQTRDSASKGSGSWSPPRTAWGHPDLQGTWTNFDRTPFEQPDPTRQTRRSTGAAGVGPAPEFSQDWAHSRVSPLRPSMVIEPKEGRVPVRPEAEARRDHDLAHLTDAPEFSSPWERCITRGVPGGMFPSDYNNAIQILQTPAVVVIYQEMVHETRTIPIDGRPHLPSALRQWMGDSRGHWEGNTLVIETTNFNDRGWIANNAATGRMKGVHSTADLRVIERITRVDANTLSWQATIQDPTVYTSPWTVAMPFNWEPDYRMFEYACHEGNYAMPNTLSAGRAADRAAAKKN